MKRKILQPKKLFIKDLINKSPLLNFRPRIDKKVSSNLIDSKKKLNQFRPVQKKEKTKEKIKPNYSYLFHPLDVKNLLNHEKFKSHENLSITKDTSQKSQNFLDYDSKNLLRLFEQTLLKLKKKNSPVVNAEVIKIFSKFYPHKKESKSSNDIEGKLRELDEKCSSIAKEHVEMKKIIRTKVQDFNSLYKKINYQKNKNFKYRSAITDCNADTEDELLELDTFDLLKRYGIKDPKKYAYYQPKEEYRTFTKPKTKVPKLDFSALMTFDDNEEEEQNDDNNEDDSNQSQAISIFNYYVNVTEENPNKNKFKKMKKKKDNILIKSTLNNSN